MEAQLEEAQSKLASAQMPSIQTDPEDMKRMEKLKEDVLHACSSWLLYILLV